MTANLSIHEMIEKALYTSSHDEISAFIKSPYMLVRRALAKNVNTTSKHIDRLSMDPVLNVSYIACNNPKSSVSRNFDKTCLPPCVTCKIKENELRCLSGCKRKEDHSF